MDLENTDMKTMKTKSGLLFALGLFIASGASALPPDSVSVMDLVNQSQEAAARNQMKSALDLARQATELDAGYGGAWKQLGSILLQQKKYNQALEPLHTAATLDTNNTSILRELSTAQWMAGQTNAALDSLHTASLMEPLNAKLWRDLAADYQSAGRNEEALKTFKISLDLDPTDALSWRDMGWTLWSLNRHKEALAALDKAIMGGVTNRRATVIQVVAQLIEANQVDEALSSLARWEPKGKPLDIAIPLVESGRLLAAQPLLLQSWKMKENPPKTGLYLAYAQSLSGNHRDIDAYLAPFLETLTPQTDAQQVRLALNAVRNCAETFDTPALVLALDDKLGKPYRQDPRLTDILEKTAEGMLDRRNLQAASELYRRMLERDPNRSTWLVAFELDLRLNGSDSAERLLADVQSRATSVVVRAAAEGKIAEQQGRYKGAIVGYEKSLAADPEQPRLKQFLFEAYLKVGRVADARAVAEWMEQKIGEGNDSLRSYAAEMWMALDEPARALGWWQILHLASPGFSYYAIQEAAADYALCKPDEAIAILEEQIASAPSSQAYELLAEIQLAQDQYGKAVETAKAGLGSTPSPGLHRYYAENAEMADVITTGSLYSAQALLKNDPGYVQGSLLEGRHLQSLGMTNETVAFYRGLLRRNPDLFAALVALKNASSANHDFTQALQYSRTIIEARPWDVESQLRHAIALSEDERVRGSLQLLRRIVKRYQPRDMVPVLLYRLVSECPYPGRNNTAQLKEHLRRLQTEGYQLVTPEQIHYPLTNSQAVVILEDANQAVLEVADQVLKDIGGRAVYAGDQGLLTRPIPGKPDPAYLKKLAASGRWLIASSGPENNLRQKISKEGVLGNPFTHPIFKGRRMETDEAFPQRLEKDFGTAAASVATAPEKILVYPYGDYGQISLDTRRDYCLIYNQVVSHHFDKAICYDDNGFLNPKFDPLRIPARVVPAQWNGDRLAEYLHRENPAVQCQAELAKLLYWNRQHEEANYWFQRALAAGADPKEITFNWGANAYQQGDQPVALRQLRTARELDPSSAKVAETLKNAENRKRVDLTLGGRYWEDNEGRSFEQGFVQADGYARDYLQLGGFANYNRWRTDSPNATNTAEGPLLPAATNSPAVGPVEERGLRLGVDALWYLYPQIWLEGQLWQLQMESDLPDLVGGQASLHLPNRWLGGYAELQISREEIETVEALRAKIYADYYELVTYSRLFDKIDVFANGQLTDRTDGNQTWLLYGRLVYRLKEWPYLGAGYLFRFGDSDFDPLEYWAPEKLEQHQLYGTLRGTWHRVDFFLTGEAGYSREKLTEWQFIWGGNVRLEWMPFRRLSLAVEGNYQESATYDRTTATAEAAVRF